MMLLLKLLLAHVLGDFVLQPAKWVAHKLERKIKSGYLYLHLLVHLLCMLVVLGFDFSLLPGVLLIVLSHYLIDLSKLYLTGKVDSKLLFVIDQIAHLAVIFFVAKYHTPLLDISFSFGEEEFLFILSLLCVTSVSSVIIRVLMSAWKMTDDGSSLSNAGMYIGILERLFVFVFIVMGQWQAIGFLIAAKSVFRFSDLTRAKDRKLTEYILIGTLLSFALGVGCSLAYLALKEKLL